jgi:hypothetical protein
MVGCLLFIFVFGFHKISKNKIYKLGKIEALGVTALKLPLNKNI